MSSSSIFLLPLFMVPPAFKSPDFAASTTDPFRNSDTVNRVAELPFSGRPDQGGSTMHPAVNVMHRAVNTMDKADQLVDDILSYTNKARAKKGLKALVMKDGLNRIAAGHSRNMATGKVPFSHDGFSDRYAEAKKEFSGLNSFAENVSFGPSTGKEVVDGWMGSKHHKENILGDFTSIGIGVASDKNGRNYFTQVFGKE